MMSYGRSTKIANFMTTMAWILELECDHVRHIVGIIYSTLLLSIHAYVCQTNSVYKYMMTRKGIPNCKFNDSLGEGLNYV